MRPWLGLLLLAGVALAAEGAWALPPIITVKNLRARAGPAYKWKVANRVISSLSGPIYPGQTGTARVSVDVERTSITKNYVVSGKLIITNPMQNRQLLEVTGLKASFSPLIPLLSPLPQQLDCPAEQLQPGQSLSCNFRIDLPSGVVNTLTPQVLVKGMPQLEGEPLTLSWPSDEDRQLPSGKVVDAESSCALIQTQVLGGDLQQLVQVSAAGEYQDMFSTGLEVCEDKASLEYTVTVGPFDESSGLCGSYTVKDISTVRLAAGSIGSSSTIPTSLAVTFGGCQPKDVLGGRKPAVSITKLTLGQLVTHEWAAQPISSTNTSNPATVKFDAEHVVDVQVNMQRTDGKEELLLTGEVTVTNTERLPYLLPSQGVRIALSKGASGSTEKRYVSVTCPMVGNNIVVRPLAGDTPGTLVCEFKASIDKEWKKGFIQAQLQTLLSTTFEVDSGAPKQYDFDDKAHVQRIAHGECVSLHIMRVTNPVDLQSANGNPAVASLAQQMGGDAFKLLTMGTVAGGRMPPPASDSTAAPMVVCGNETVAWRETYGPFTEYDCGPNMALMGLSARPISGQGNPISATLAFPMAVKSCTIVPNIVSMGMHPYAANVYKWSAHQERLPQGDVHVPRQKIEAVKYHVTFQRSASVAGFKLAGIFKVMNPHQASVNLDSITYSISRPTGAPIVGEAECSGTLDEAYEVYTGSGIRTKHKTNPVMLPQSSSQASSDGSSSSSTLDGGITPANVTPPPARKKIKLAAANFVNKQQSTAAGALTVAAIGGRTPALYGESLVEPQYEEGGHGPLFCSFEAHLPDDYPSEVQLEVTTDEGAKVTESLGRIDWVQAETKDENKCALVSFSFAQEYNSFLQPSKIEGDAPPALAVKLCEPREYHFTALFGPWSVTGPCGPREARSVATISLPYATTVISCEDTLNIDVVGCQEPLPTLTVDATQHPVQDAFVWSIVRKMTPVKAKRKHQEPKMNVAGPDASCPDPAILTLAAKPNTGPHAGGYAKFNQTITVKRSKPKNDKKQQLFEVKGEVTVVNNADKPLHLQYVQVKISCDGDHGDKKPVFVKATCPEELYDSSYGPSGKEGQSHFTIPSAASAYGASKPIKCQFGAVVPGPGPISVQASAVMFDGRKAKAKHTVHLELRADFFKPRSLGSCIRIREWQQVQDSVTGKASYELLTSGGHIPEDGVEVCQGRTWSSIIRVGPLNPHTSHECQAVKFKSCVQGFPSSGYQGELKSDGIVDVHTKNCQRDFDDADSEDDSKDGDEKPEDKGDSYEEKPSDEYKKPTGQNPKAKDGHKGSSHKNDSKHAYKGDGKGKEGYSGDKDKGREGHSSHKHAAKEEDEGAYHEEKKQQDDDGEPQPHSTDVMPPLPGSYLPQPSYGSSRQTHQGPKYSGGRLVFPKLPEGEHKPHRKPTPQPTSGSVPGGVPVPPPNAASGGSSVSPNTPGPAVKEPQQGLGGSNAGSNTGGGSSGSNGSSGSSGSNGSNAHESVEDDDDGEGTGEGFDDNQRVDFWKGSSKSKLPSPDYGGYGEKLVTSSLTPQSLGQLPVSQPTSWVAVAKLAVAKLSDWSSSALLSPGKATGKVESKVSTAAATETKPVAQQQAAQQKLKAQ